MSRKSACSQPRDQFALHTAVTEIGLKTAVKPCLSLIFSEDSEEKDVKTKKDDSHSAGN